VPYAEDQNYDTPPDETRLWRYMSCAKFLYFLEHGLFLPSFETLRQTDPFEGTHTAGELDHLERLTQAGRFAQHLPTLYEAIYTTHTFLSSWCEGPSENSAMWRSFVGTSVDCGVAIGTTVRALKGALFSNDSPSNIGRARYDFSADASGHVEGHRFFLRKRPELAHEREVRAVLYDPRHYSPGITLPVENPSFVEEIRVCPGAPTWFLTQVTTLATKAGVRRGRVRRSSLDEKPASVRPNGG
jgi:hypothetical protein